MIAHCPNCGADFPVFRRPDGSGTEPNGQITPEETRLLDLMKAFPIISKTRRQIESLIYEKKIPEGLSDHNTQRPLSLLVGRGLVKMDVSKRPYLYSVI